VSWEFKADAFIITVKKTTPDGGYEPDGLERFDQAARDAAHILTPDFDDETNTDHLDRLFAEGA
jgi:hypothetical protein